MEGHMIRNLQEGPNTVEVQETTFSIDVLGRYTCNTYDEAVSNGGFPFDAIVIGGGMYGAYIAEKIYRQGQGNLRVLILEAGSFLVSEHVQNLSRIGLNAAGPITVDPGTARERVWGLPWRSNVGFPGLAYCVGGRSLYWGGWSPRLTDADLNNWPAELQTYLKANYSDTEKETGVDPVTDFISGDLFDALKSAMDKASKKVATVDGVEVAPLAVQGSAPAPGIFPFDKYSSTPILTDAIREAASNPDNTRRLFLVPHAHVVRLHNSNGVINAIELYYNGQQSFLGVTPDCAVILAAGTIESTRLALESFPTPLMGRNLMAHLRSNTTVRIPRAVLGTLPKQLAAAAMLVRGSTPQGRYHLQVTAAAIDSPDSERTMWRVVPDLDLLDQLLSSQDFNKVTITFRGIGEMAGDKNAANTNPASSWVDLSPFEHDEFGMRRAFVNLVTTPQALTLWDTMDQAAVQLAQALAGSPANLEYFYDNRWHAAPPPAGKVRDGLRTAHAIVQKAVPAPAVGAVALLSSTLDGWQMAGSGKFNVVGNKTVQSEGG